MKCNNNNYYYNDKQKNNLLKVNGIMKYNNENF